MPWKIASANAQLAYDTILQQPAKGIPTWIVHIMEHSQIERIAGYPPGSYRKDPHTVYLGMERAIGVCLIDQYLAENPLTMGDHGYEGKKRTATTGADQIVCDGMVIDSPEAAVEHLERVVFPNLRKAIASFDEGRRAKQIVANEVAVQERIGPSFLKTMHGVVSFPHYLYGTYGYENYFMAYALYPEVMEKLFSLQADYGVLNNRAVARAYREGDLPPLCRLDSDMADSRGTLTGIQSLDRLFFPHFARALEPMTRTDVKMIWHCDGNLMQMVPRLIACGVRGFQGFQYEDGMDYERICRMKTREGNDLLIIGGVSVTRTLPYGRPVDVRRQLDWLVRHGPKMGLFLACTSSVAPGVPWENIQALIEGLSFYRTHARG